MSPTDRSPIALLPVLACLGLVPRVSSAHTNFNQPTASASRADRKTRAPTSLSPFGGFEWPVLASGWLQGESCTWTRWDKPWQGVVCRRSDGDARRRLVMGVWSGRPWKLHGYVVGRKTIETRSRVATGTKRILCGLASQAVALLASKEKAGGARDRGNS
jgi:hypothetical protein